VPLVSPLRPLLASALLGLNLGVHAAPADTAITFDTAPRAGQHQRQLIDMQAVIKMRAEAGPDATDEQRAKIAQAAERMALMGPMKMSMQMQQTMKAGQPDAEGWLPLTVEMKAKAGQMTLGDKTVPLPKQASRDLAFVARFNPKDFNFEIQKVEGSPQLDELMRTQGNAMVGQVLQLSKALSQRPMKVGDTVDVPLTMNLPVPLPGGAGSMDGLVHYTLARVDRGVAHFDLSMDLKMDISAPAPIPAAAASASAPDAASAPASGAAPKTLHVQINGGGKGNSSLRLADRLPLSNKLTMDMQMKMDMPDNGLMLMDMNMVMQAKGESLTKSAPAKAKAEAPKKKS
jgi:hypothetical protein